MIKKKGRLRTTERIKRYRKKNDYVVLALNSMIMEEFLQTKNINEKLTERFNKERNIRICCTIELDQFNNIINNKSSPSLFYSLPLVGSVSYIYELLFNSGQFKIIYWNMLNNNDSNGSHYEIKAETYNNQQQNEYILFIVFDVQLMKVFLIGNEENCRR
ncbi:hypothetical protein U3516DRAFT_750413 [Neocallimastix sp. 'constans']